MNIENNRKILVSDQVLFQEVGGETVLLDLASEQYFGLDEVGTRVWQLLNKGQSLDEIVNALVAEYEVERERLEADVRALLDSLREAGLIVGGV
jgi:chromosome condensin MukBEF MukE localization factor